VEEQPVAGDRINVLATIDPPRIAFSTHYDCVPPFFDSRVEDGRLYGRGSCDAKGILAAQVTALERLRARGVRDVGALYVVGEERGSDGAKAANALANGCRYLINGEPTDSRLAAGTRGAWRVRLAASGRAAHSSHPEAGESAIDKLIDALVRLRGASQPESPLFGRTHYTVGLISGGVAPNVIPPHAEAEVMFRTVGPVAALRPAIDSLRDLVEPSTVLDVPAVELTTVPGFDTEVFPFTTDIPFLDQWGAPLLMGPGSIFLAHTAGEYVEMQELQEAVEKYESLALSLRDLTKG
jgi:acetylornithine deacetylase